MRSMRKEGVANPCETRQKLAKMEVSRPERSWHRLQWFLIVDCVLLQSMGMRRAFVAEMRDFESSSSCLYFCFCWCCIILGLLLLIFLVDSGSLLLLGYSCLIASVQSWESFLPWVSFYLYFWWCFSSLFSHFCLHSVNFFPSLYRHDSRS